MRGLPLHEAMKAIVIVILESAKRLNSPELACTGARTNMHAHSDCSHTGPSDYFNPSDSRSSSAPPPAHSVTYGETLSSANSDNTTRSYQTLVNLRSHVLECLAGVLKITRLCLFESLLHSRKVIWLKPTRRGDSVRRRLRRHKEEKTAIRHFQTERTILPLI